MPIVEIYESSHCPYCVMAKRLLDKKGVEYTRYNISTDEARWKEMLERSDRRSVPQIFIAGKLVGGFDDMAALEKSGDLDALLFPA